MSNEQGDIVHSSLGQGRSDELDLFADLDEIHRGIRDFQARDVADGEKSKIILDLRTHFAYLEHVAILTGDSVRLEPEFHGIEGNLRWIEGNISNYRSDP
jgi:hypothetical protein